MNKVTLLTPFIFLLLPSFAFAEIDWTKAIKKTNDTFSDMNNNTPGCAVGVIHSGKYVLSKGYGMANLEHNIPITTQSVFRIGSLSKQFTAAAIALLAEQGKIDLDIDVKNYLPDLAKYGVKVTIRQMIHHLSGIPDYEDGKSTTTFSKEDGSNFRFGNEDYYTIKEFYDHAKTMNLKHNPETTFDYSNTAYFFLSQVVKNMTGNSLRKFSEKEIFSKLNMKNSFFNDNVNEIVPNRVDGYKKLNDGSFNIYMTNLSWVGEGGVYTTIDDFLAWDNNFYNNKIGTTGNSFIEKLESPHPFFEKEKYPYAWGMFVKENKQSKVVFHSGAWVGFQSYYIRYPKLALSLVALCNSSDIDPSQRLSDVRDEYINAIKSYKK